MDTDAILDRLDPDSRAAAAKNAAVGDCPKHPGNSGLRRGCRERVAEDAAAAEADRITADHPQTRAAWHRLAAERGAAARLGFLRQLRWWCQAATTIVRAAWKDEFGPGAGQ